MRNNFLPLVFLFLFSFIASCTNNSKVSLVGKWKPVQVDSKFISSYHMSDEDIKKLPESQSIEFTKDQKFISNLPHDTSYGTYDYDEKAKRLITMMNDGKNIIFFIRFLGKDKMAMSNQNGKMTFARN